MYTGIKEIVDKNEEEERPKYVETSKEKEGSQHSFENIEEASSFWKALWEKEGSGDISAKRVEEVKSAINSRVAAPTDEQFLLTKEEAVNVIRKKRNWSALGPDLITNYWWKMAYSLHEGASNAFVNIVQHDHEYLLWFAEGKTSLIPKAGEFSSENQRPITCLNKCTSGLPHEC